MASASSSTPLLRSFLRAAAAARQASAASSSAPTRSPSARPQRRAFATSAPSSSSATLAEDTDAAADAAAASRATASHVGRRSSSNIKVSLLLSRQPLLLRSPTPLESAYFDYNHALTRRLAQPFNKDLYFRKGSAAETKFDAEERHRRTHLDFPPASSSSASKGSEGKAKSKDTSAPPPPSHGSTAGEAAASTDSGAELHVTLPRTTKADEAKDTTSLGRALDRCLFLLIKDASTGTWRLPERGVNLGKKETLHRVATLPVKEALGDQMDIWLVSHLPIAVVPRPVVGTKTKADKTYFLRAHIISGSPKSAEGTEYAWLTKEEIEERLGSGESREYLDGIRDLLSE